MIKKFITGTPVHLKARTLIFFPILSMILAMTALPQPGFSQKIPTFNGKKAFAYLTKQCDFGPRNPGSKGHQDCCEFLYSELKKFSQNVEKQPFLHSFGQPTTTVTMTNIIARFYPDNSERVLLGAHWDTRPWADQEQDVNKHNQPILGANDGASGVAILLEIARVLKNNKPGYGVDLVFFDGEDCGWHGDDRSWAVGSQFFAKSVLPPYQPVWGVILDMVGDRNLQLFQEINSLELAKPVVTRFWNKAAELGIYQFIPEPGFKIIDDHMALLHIGIPVIDIIDFDYPYWHTLEDTPDKCSAASLQAVGQVVIARLFE